jgi:hypothetical protein
MAARGFSLDSIGSDSLEKDTHAFVIRIWKEEPGDDDHPALWRGHITHAYTGERQFFQDLSSLLDFIVSYLNADL